MFFDFLKMLGVTLSLAWLLLYFVSYFFPQAMLFREILIGCLLPVACFIPGFYVVSQTVQSSWKAFLTAVVGGMLIRLLCIGTIFVLLVVLTQFHITTLLFSLVGFYTLCLIVELYFVSSRMPHKEGV